MAVQRKHTRSSHQLKRRNLLSDKEKELLDRIFECDRVNTAANHLGITDRTAYNVLYRIRLKYVMARLFVNTILNYRKKSDILERVLSRRLSLEEEEIKGALNEE